MNMIDVIRRRMMMGGKGDPIVVWADHDKIAEYIVNQQYDLGLCASNEYLTQSEAALVQMINSNGKVTILNEKDKDYSYFQWFVNAEFQNTYSYFVYGGFMIVPPRAIDDYDLGILRFRNSKIVLLSHVPKPIFSAYRENATVYNRIYGGNMTYEITNALIYVPDDSYEGWLPYIEAAVNCPSWMSNTGITLHRISELSASELSKIKIPY